MKNLTIFLILLCVGCGYSPIYKKGDQLNFEFNEIVIEGDEKIKRQIFSDIDFKKNISLKKNFVN